MVCRHSPGDPNCSSYPSWKAENDRQNKLESDAARVRAVELEIETLRKRTPNPNQYDIIDVVEVENHLVAMVKYSSCQNCSFDSKKVMVFENTTLKDAVHWRKIDPHFKEHITRIKSTAPSPIARFPASTRGWELAKKFAHMLNREPMNDLLAEVLKDGDE